MKELTFTLTVEETNLVMQGLGNMPFAQVHELVGKFQKQASEQVNEAKQTNNENADNLVSMVNE